MQTHPFRLPAGGQSALIAILSTGLVLSIAGCDQSQLTTSGPSTLPLTKLTPASQCIVNAENDVIIGGPNAKPDCDNVVMAPSSDNPTSFDEIKVAEGGTLTITGDTGEESSTAGVEPHDSIPIVPVETPIREICIMNGGTVEYGTKAKPITSKNKVVLEFLGKRGAPLDNTCPNFQKGIEVMAGGTLRMFGTKGVPARGGVSWTTLAAPAGPAVAGAKVAPTGTTTLKLSDDVTKGAEGWAAGDWIVVATTSFSPFESEFVQIASVKSGGASGGSTVTLKQPLKYYHFGSLPPSSADETCTDPLDSSKTQPKFLCDGADRNWGVDERAEVGLISRDIELTSNTEPVTTVPPPATSSVHWGGEIMIHPGFKEVVIQGVRLSKFGKDQLGSYPIHFHKIGEIGANQTIKIDANSVDHSYNKCITIHNTSNLTISNMVCARIVGHIFYQELDKVTTANDSGIVYKHNLGLGAMSNSFDIYPVTVDGKTITRQQLIDTYWWAGDYLTNAQCKADNTCIGYDGFNIPDTDDWKQPTHGQCTTFLANGRLGGYTPPPCTGNSIYIEPASGFWIQNPDTVLVDNAIGGCQGVGRAFWWVPPPIPIQVNGKDMTLGFEPLGEVKNNRAHSCYAGFYGEGEYSVISGQPTPHKDGTNGSPSIISTFDGVTATRNRFRGLWLRSSWIVVKNSHFATNRESVSLVSSGGIDGNAPGTWYLLTDSVLVGMSQNNVDRWGPCPKENQLGLGTGGEWGCVDRTPPPAGIQAHSGDELGQGYMDPHWNASGYMLYDGPVRVFHNRFVNFNYDNPNGTNKEFSGELTDADQIVLKNYESTHSSPTGEGPPMPYEGDAALGWFQSNQSAYPTGTATRELIWVNTNLRHQIYTEKVSLSKNFNDGDKNTAIIDEDGTLSGLGVQLAPGAGSNPVHAVSLNNLPFNATSNSVDECFSRGGQNELYEGRDSSLMSPATMGTLEFSSLYPYLPGDGRNEYPGGTNTHWQNMTFTRDDAVDNGKGGSFHPTMVMQTGRNGLGIWEPKVSNGYGYTVTVQPTTSDAAPKPPPPGGWKAGIWKWIELGLADVVDPNISKAHPFFIQLGINYTSADGSHPANKFVITRGYKSYTGGAVWPGDPQLLKYWTPLDCNNLDANNIANIPWSGNGFQGKCPSGPTTQLTKVNSIAGLTNPDGAPNLGVYYYNQTTGYLYLNVAQDEPNPVAPSPTGSCVDVYDDGKPSPACPDTSHSETYYACPKNGCIIYSIAMKDSSYTPGTSVGAPAPADAKPVPVNQNKLVRYGTDTVVTQQIHLDKQGVPYHTASPALNCKLTQPAYPTQGTERR